MTTEVFLAVWWLVGFAGWVVVLRACGASRWWMDLVSGVLVVGWMGPLVWLGLLVCRRANIGPWERPVAPLADRSGRVVVVQRPRFRGMEDSAG